MNTERENIANENGMSIEFVNWFFDNKKAGCGNVWFMMMAAMWEGWKPQNEKLTESERYGRQADITIENLERKVEQLAAENACLMQLIDWPKQQCPTTGDVTDVEPADFIPSTSAFLAEVRASGVEMFANHIALYNSDSEQHANLFAAQLREGKKVTS